MALGRRAVVVIVAASGASAALAALYVLAPWGSSVPASPPVPSPVSAASADASVAAAMPSESLEPLESQLELPVESPLESMTASTPSDSMPPCRRYYPACGKFSMPGVVADEDCGCRPDETCSRTGATGWCVRKPRWLGP